MLIIYITVSGHLPGGGGFSRTFDERHNFSSHDDCTQALIVLTKYTDLRAECKRAK